MLLAVARRRVPVPRSTGRPQRTLAILPFESDDPAADAWFVDAITGDLNTMVARWRGGAPLVGRGTMQAYKGKGADPRAVGRELGVAHVLTGRVRREGERVRIDVELVDTGNGQVLWALPFDIDRGELPGSVGDIAGGIAKALNIEIGDVVTRNVRTARPGAGRRRRPRDARLVGVPQAPRPGELRAGAAAVRAGARARPAVATGAGRREPDEQHERQLRLHQRRGGLDAPLAGGARPARGDRPERRT